MAINAGMNAKMYRDVKSGKWVNIPEDIKAAFLNRKYRIVKVPASTRLYKMTANPFDPTRVSPWWAPVEAFLDDKDGALMRFKEAAYNGVSVNDYMRIANAVSADFNELGKYQEIRLKDEALGMWGQFEPMPIASSVEAIAKGRKLDKAAATDFRAKKLAVALKGLPSLPAVLGGLGAWQLWIPNLTGNVCEEVITHDNSDVWISQFFHIDLPAAHSFITS